MKEDPVDDRDESDQTEQPSTEASTDRTDAVRQDTEAEDNNILFNLAIDKVRRNLEKMFWRMSFHSLLVKIIWSRVINHDNRCSF